MYRYSTFATPYCSSNATQTPIIILLGSLILIIFTKTPFNIKTLYIRTLMKIIISNLEFMTNKDLLVIKWALYVS